MKRKLRILILAVLATTVLGASSSVFAGCSNFGSAQCLDDGIN